MNVACEPQSHSILAAHFDYLLKNTERYSPPCYHGGHRAELTEELLQLIDADMEFVNTSGKAGAQIPHLPLGDD
jgi:hypothetical protein